jgi:ABC-type polysaccharide/polyol phosphate transport system ATPase subunit
MSGAGDAAIRLTGVGKRYVKYEDVPALLTSVLRFSARSKRSHLWALRHVDLEVAQGETVGVIGRNGSGKTTMLRMLAGVTAPTEGVVHVRGRVAPLISVGVGFHDELTGRENVYVNGSVLGMTRAEIDKLFDHIVGFAELEEFIDTPVKFYSSGMWLRLGFSVAVASKPDILLVDEVLAVGDISFQMKGYERMLELKNQGTSVIVVSHNLEAIRNLCSRVLLLHRGENRFLGPTHEAISVYHELLDQTTEHDATERKKPVHIVQCQLLGEDGQMKQSFAAREIVTCRVRVRFDQAVEGPTFGFTLQSDAGLPVYIDSNYQEDRGSFAAGDEVECEIRFPLDLTTGSYMAHAVVRWGEDPDAATTSRLMMFFVSGRHMVFGVSDLHASFELKRPSESFPPTGTPGDAVAGAGGSDAGIST